MRCGVAFVKKDGYNTYFQDLFASSRHSRLSLHLKWEGWFMKLGDTGTLKGKVLADVTAGVLRLLEYGSRAQLEALTKLCNRDEGFNDAALLLGVRKRLQKVVEKTYEAGKAIDEEVLDGVLVLGMACMQMQTGESLPYQQGEEGLCYAVWGGPC